MRILLVDDNPDIRLSLTAALSRRGHQVVTAATSESALSLAATTEPDVGVIDVMLPDGDGFTLCREIRAQFRFPTVMLTARDDEVDVVGGLEAGADDYIVKPVSPAVLEARLRAVVRRIAEVTRAMQQPETIVIGQIVINETSLEVFVDGELVQLSATELHLLRELAAHPGRVLSRSHLIDHVWRDQPPNTPRVVDTAIQRLRAKLAEAGAESPSLETIRGSGYRLT
jgi:DNA-binding response OmpR family regulator